MIPSRELIPGGIVHAKVGEIVTVDMKIINGTVSINESALTGESIDVTKDTGESIFPAFDPVHKVSRAQIGPNGKQLNVQMIFDAFLILGNMSIKK